MAKCDTCGNDYDKAFQITMGGRTMTFDSFECAIQPWHPSARLVGAASSVTVWRQTANSFAVTTALR